MKDEKKEYTIGASEVDFSDEDAVSREIAAQRGLAQIRLFERAYPDVDIEALFSNEAFIKCLEGADDPLITVYEMYLAKNTKPEEEISKISTGSVKSSGTASHASYFTRDEVMSMTPEQVRKNLNKIHKSMPKWKI